MLILKKSGFKAIFIVLILKKKMWKENQNLINT